MNRPDEATVRAADDRARLSMFMGLGSLVCSMALGIPAIIFGLLARRDASRGGRTNATIGIVLGLLTLLPPVVLVGTIFVNRYAENARESEARNAYGMFLMRMYRTRDTMVAAMPPGQCPSVDSVRPVSATLDFWGTPFSMDCASDPGTPALKSAGPDRTWGTDDDLSTNPSKK